MRDVHGDDLTQRRRSDLPCRVFSSPRRRSSGRCAEQHIEAGRLSTATWSAETHPPPVGAASRQVDPSSSSRWSGAGFGIRHAAARGERDQDRGRQVDVVSEQLDRPVGVVIKHGLHHRPMLAFDISPFITRGEWS